MLLGGINVLFLPIEHYSNFYLEFLGGVFVHLSSYEGKVMSIEAEKHQPTADEIKDSIFATLYGYQRTFAIRILENDLGTRDMQVAQVGRLDEVDRIYLRLEATGWRVDERKIDRR